MLANMHFACWQGRAHWAHARCVDQCGVLAPGAGEHAALTCVVSARCRVLQRDGLCHVLALQGVDFCGVCATCVVCAQGRGEEAQGRQTQRLH